MFDDTKEVIKNRKLKDIQTKQYNGQKKNYKSTNNDQQDTSENTSHNKNKPLVVSVLLLSLQIQW